MREVLYGRQAVRESLRAARRQPYQMMIARGTAKAPIIDEIIEIAHQQHIPISHSERSQITEFTGTIDHQGIALETSAYPYVSVEDSLSLAESKQESCLLLILDLIQDIHNAGSLARTAEATGVHGIIIQERRAAGVTPAAVNASAGAFEHLYVSCVTNLAQEINQLKRANIWIAGLEENPDGRIYTDCDLSVPLALVVGSEGKGLRKLVRESCDWLMAIPMRGKINSLNAAIAGSVVLYEVLKQRHASHINT
jgi:23S rRNA (guanosine2251-2'-O)-methyltransferase